MMSIEVTTIPPGDYRGAEEPPVFPHFARPGRHPERGFYLARRVSWRPNSGWVPVMVREALANSSGELLVFEPGAKKPDPLGKWVFLSEIVGLERLPDHVH